MATNADRKPIVERLGYAPGSKLLIVHADDIGMSHNVNVASLDAMTRGWVSSGSIMVPCPWFPEAAIMAKEHPELDLGIHATLTSEWLYYRWRPVAASEHAIGLLDSDGFMWRDVEGTAGHASVREIETEIRAQVQRALDFGIRPTHLDTHMGTVYARPEYFDAYRRVAHEFELPYMVPRPTADPLSADDPRRRIYTPERLAEIESAGDVMLDAITYHIPVGPRDRLQFYLTFIGNLRPGLTQLVIHCGGDTEELRAITSNWENRVADAQAWVHPAIKDALDEHKIHLVRWRDIKGL
jgi:predicted glycoside hydrolase/deacetylase ChbG (UPF0249 family)